MPQLCIEIYRAVQDADTEVASALQEKLRPLARAVTKTYGIGGLKAAMDMAGFVGGVVRAPLAQPDEVARAEIACLLGDALGALFNALDTGKAYLDIHTTAFPDGEIRGFLQGFSVTHT